MINIIKPNLKPITDEILAKHVFSTTELLEISQRLAGVIQRTVTIEDEKKQVMSGYKANLDELASKQNNLATQIANGYEMRNTPCILTMDYEHGKKLYHHRTTGELISEVDMKQSDYQQKLQFVAFDWDGAGICKNPILINVRWGDTKYQIHIASSGEIKWHYNIETDASRFGVSDVSKTANTFKTAQGAVDAANIELGAPSSQELMHVDIELLPPGTVIELVIEYEQNKQEEKPKARKKKAAAPQEQQQSEQTIEVTIPAETETPEDIDAKVEMNEY